LLEAVVFDQLRVVECVAPFDGGIVDAVEEHVQTS
jgi:hypothetical protein